MMAQMLFVTGTDTGVGKTVLTALLAHHLRKRSGRIAALKPIGSGGRGDARAHHAALGGALTLDEINPWHFRAPLAPLLAARREKRPLKLAQVLAHVRRIQQRFSLVLVEGTGGLLSPLGEDFDSRDLIRTLRARPIVVCPNRLGAINQTLLVLAALPGAASRHAQVVLMSPERSDAASRGNPRLLAERLGPERIHVLPWLEYPRQPDRALANRWVRAAIRSLTQSAGV
jgi:dethiobiotin synthetase